MGTPLQVEVSVLDKLSAHVAQMNNTLGGFAKNVNSSFDSITKGVMAAGSALGVFATLNTLKNAIQQGINYGDTISDMAKRTGLTTTAVQELSFVAKQSGTNIEALQKSFINLSVKAYANDSAFKTLGISLRDNNGILKGSGALFNETIIKLAGVQNNTERTAISQKIFGRAAADVNAIISEGAEKVQSLVDNTKTYGLILDESTVAALDKAKDSMDTLKTATSVLGAEFAEAFAPAITTVTLKIAKFFGALRGEAQTNEGALRAALTKYKEDFDSLKESIGLAEASNVARIAIDNHGTFMSLTLDQAKARLDSLRTSIRELEGDQKKINGGKDLGGGDPNAEKKRAQEEVRRINDIFSGVDKEFEANEFNALDVFLGDKLEQEQRASEINDVFSNLTDNLIKEDKAATDALLDSQKEIRDSEKKTSADKKEAVSATVSSLQYLAGKHREFMGMYKVAAVFQIGADTFSSAQAAFRGFQTLPQPFGMIAGGIAAASITAAGLARANDVRKQSFVSGGEVVRLGEQGPENAWLPYGSRIFNNNETRNMNTNQSTVLNVSIVDRSGNLVEEFHKELRRGGESDRLISYLSQKLAAN
jgi:hypothetical protein